MINLDPKLVYTDVVTRKESNNQVDKIIECRSVEAIRPYFIQCTDRTLVVLDIDDVLRMPKEPAFQKASLEKYKHLVKETLKKFTPEGNVLLGGIFLQETTPDHVDSAFPEAINYLQKRSVKAIGLSSSSVGQVRGELIEQKRFNELKELGIDMSTSFPDWDMSLDNLTSTLNVYPQFYKGLGLTNRDQNSKGTVLLAILDRLGWMPEKVLIVEDTLSNIEEIQSKLAVRKISCQGILFTGCLQYPLEPVSEEEFKKQWNELLRKTEEAAQELGIKLYKE